MALKSSPSLSLCRISVHSSYADTHVPCPFQRYKFARLWARISFGEKCWITARERLLFSSSSMRCDLRFEPAGAIPRLVSSSASPSPTPHSVSTALGSITPSEFPTRRICSCIRRVITCYTFVCKRLQRPLPGQLLRGHSNCLQPRFNQPRPLRCVLANDEFQLCDFRRRDGEHRRSNTDRTCGSNAARSRCDSSFAMSCDSSMLAMILSCPPQRAQLSICTPNTRFSRRAQLIPTCRGLDGLVASAPDTGAFGAPPPRCAGVTAAAARSALR